MSEHEYEEVSFYMKESVLKELKCLCNEILDSKVKYNKNQLEMANNVISQNRLNLILIKNILDKIDNKLNQAKN